MFAEGADAVVEGLVGVLGGVLGLGSGGGLFGLYVVVMGGMFGVLWVGVFCVWGGLFRILHDLGKALILEYSLEPPQLLADGLREPKPDLIGKHITSYQLQLARIESLRL